MVVWDGNGLNDASMLTTTGAPKGTNITSEAAWALFVSGKAMVPTNLLNGMKSAQPMPLNLQA